MVAIPKTAAVLLLASVLTIDASSMFPLFDTVKDIPQEYFNDHRTIYGRVERVIDGDTIRIKHCRSRFFGCPKFDPQNPRKRIYDTTLSIRAYAVDCPELQKRKNDPPSQPFAQEAKDYATGLLYNKKVRVKLLSRDQYGRAVAKVETGLKPFPPLSRRDLSMEMAKRGYATLYTGGGAQYDDNRATLEKAIGTAQKKRRGLWSLDDFKSPADFKREQKQLSKQR